MARVSTPPCLLGVFILHPSRPSQPSRSLLGSSGLAGEGVFVRPPTLLKVGDRGQSAADSRNVSRSPYLARLSGRQQDRPATLSHCSVPWPPAASVSSVRAPLSGLGIPRCRGGHHRQLETWLPQCSLSPSLVGCPNPPKSLGDLRPRGPHPHEQQVSPRRPEPAHLTAELYRSRVRGK